MIQNHHNGFTREDFACFLFIPLALFIFYPGLFFAKMGALVADHWEQHYPWAYIFSNTLKHGALPFWTPSIMCGFPIAAEGQIGVFYLPNLLLYSLLPLHWAYSYMYVFHFLIVGWGTYGFLRQVRLIPLAALVGSLIYLFGASYGGAFYNITSLKTLAWFPVALFAFELFYASGKYRYVFFLTFVITLSLLAGYLQMAVLAIFIFFVYVLLRVFVFNEPSKSTAVNRLKGLVGAFLALAGGILISAPQLYLTRELALLSNRAVAAEEYAYVGSMSPGVFVTVLLPVLQSLFRGNSIYIGIFPFFLLISAVLFPISEKEKRFFRLWLVMTGVAALLALGQWSPLYVVLIKLSHFYAFRFPAKFLIFICFGFSVLCALGLQKAWMANRLAGVNSILKKVGNVYLATCAGFVLAVLASYVVLVWFRAPLRRMGFWLIEQLIFQKPGHPYSLELYQKNLDALFDHAVRILSFQNGISQLSYCFLLIGVVFALILLRSKIYVRAWIAAGFIFLAIDFYVFSWWDFRSDLDDYTNLAKKSFAVVPIVSAIGKQEGRLYGFRRTDESLPIIPSSNMLYGIEDVGGYSPLVSARYYETIGLFGNVNDSNWMKNPSAGFVLEHLKLLSALDVGFILTGQALNHANLKIVEADPAGGYFLYRNLAEHSRAFFVTQYRSFENWDSLRKKFLAPGFDPRKELLIEHSELLKLKTMPTTNGTDAQVFLSRIQHSADREVWRLDTDRSGFFVLMNSFFPGWTVQIDGYPAPMLSGYGLFQAVWISQAGKHSIEFAYQPFQHWRLSTRCLKR